MTVTPLASPPLASEPARSGRRGARRWWPGVLATAGVVLLMSGTATAPATDLPGWDLVLVEDFDSDAGLGDFATTYPGWAAYDGARDTSRDLGRPATTQGRYDSATTTTVHHGVADVRLHTADGTPQVMALSPTADGDWWAGQLYGRYAVRFRSDPVPGYKVAWLLWPSSDDWTEGEVDFPEGALGEEIEGNAHDVTGDPEANAWHVDTGTTMDQWHTAVIEWTPERLTFLLDDQSWTTTDPQAVPRDPMRWVLQTETELGTTAPPADADGHVQIDWVAVWRPA